MLRMLGSVDVVRETGRDFARARRGAFFGRLGGRLAARLRSDTPVESAMKRLACFGEAGGRMDEAIRVRRGLETIEVEKISGSVGRCQDFDRNFLPLCSCIRDRWRRVDRAFLEGRLLPPVELYKLRDEYFVLDGNHRVSVACYRGVGAVDAVVTEFLDPCGCTFSRSGDL